MGSDGAHVGKALVTNAANWGIKAGRLKFHRWVSAGLRNLLASVID